MPVVQTALQTLTLTIIAPLTITTTALPEVAQGQAYSFQMTASGGSGSYTWSATGLPAGLSISAGGLITGTPTVSGTFPVAFSVTDG